MKRFLLSGTVSALSAGGAVDEAAEKAGRALEAHVKTLARGWLAH